MAMLRNAGSMSVLIAGAALPLGRFPRAPGVALRRVQCVSLHAPMVRVEAEGAPAGPLRVTTTDAKMPLRVLA